FDFNSYGLGAYAINVTATDADNDRADDALTSTASQSVTVTDDDTTPPIITLGGSSGTETDGQNQLFTWNVDDPESGMDFVSVLVTKDGTAIFTSSDASGSFDFNSYGLGEFQIFVSAGNADNDWVGGDKETASGLRVDVVSDDDVTPPQIVLEGSTGAETDGDNQHFTWDISDSDSGLSNLHVTITRDDGTGPVVIYGSNNLADAL